MADKKLVDQIVAAKGFAETDRPWLDALGDDQLTKFAAHCAPTVAAAPKVDDPEDKIDGGADEAAEDAKGKKKSPAAMEAAPAPVVKTEAEILAQLAPERREMFAQMDARWAKETADLKAQIVANSAGTWTEPDLADFNREKLTKLAATYKPRDYSALGINVHDATADGGTKVPRMIGVKIGSGAAA